MSGKTLGYETCSGCGRLHRTAEMVPAHIPVGDSFELEEYVLCPDCFGKLREVVCKSCEQFYYVTEEMLHNEEIKRMVESRLCPRCYAKQKQAHR
jgi:NAD-dependent SIR2 family protein deacetylase